MSQYYFTKSGDYGPRHTMPKDSVKWMIIPTSHWTEHMWIVIKNATNELRYDVANHFSINIHSISKGVCKGCKLNPEQLEGQWLIGIEQSIDYENWKTNVSELVEQGEI
jgi:hypothetical protein